MKYRITYFRDVDTAKEILDNMTCRTIKVVKMEENGTETEMNNNMIQEEADKEKELAALLGAILMSHGIIGKVIKDWFFKTVLKHVRKEKELYGI